MNYYIVHNVLFNVRKKVLKGEHMKKTFMAAALFIATAICTTGLSNAAPQGAPDGPQMKRPPIQAPAVKRPDFTEILLGDKELNLTEKQKKDLKRVTEQTHKKVRKLDKKARDYELKVINTKEEKYYAIDEHFRKIQDILTDEQKEYLYNEHQKRVEERLNKLKEFHKQSLDKKNCKCGPECKCEPNCKCDVHKKGCPIDKKKCNGAKKPCVQPKPQPQKK